MDRTISVIFCKEQTRWSPKTPAVGELNVTMTPDIIYALVDPETNDVRYVGKTTNPSRRIKAHLSEKEDTRKGRWLRGLMERGLRPILIVLEDVPIGDDWQKYEIKWISLFRDCGADLCNDTDGGFGLNGASAETRMKLASLRNAEWADPDIRKELLAKLKSPDRRRKISEALTGKKHTPEHVAKLPQNRPGRVLSPEHRAKVVAGLKPRPWPKGVPRAPETIEKMRRAALGNKYALGRVMPEWEKRKRSESMLGKKKTPQQRENSRLAALARWAREREQKNEISA